MYIASCWVLEDHGHTTKRGLEMEGHLDFALELRYPPIKVDHALLEILAEPTDVQILGRVRSVVVLELPLAECPRQAGPSLTERGPLPWVLPPGALH